MVIALWSLALLEEHHDSVGVEAMLVGHVCRQHFVLAVGGVVHNGRKAASRRLVR